MLVSTGLRGNFDDETKIDRVTVIEEFFLYDKPMLDLLNKEIYK